jgi:hypothetical protein
VLLTARYWLTTVALDIGRLRRGAVLTMVMDPNVHFMYNSVRAGARKSCCRMPLRVCGTRFNGLLA